MPTGKTTLCISIAKTPGHFGMTVHNAGYRALDLDFFYCACRVDDVASAVTGIRALGIRGCSVSMPFKETVIPYLDALDPTAQSIGAVNTIVNTNGQLIGYNTDVIGVREALLPHLSDVTASVVVLGTGGVARAVLKALAGLGVQNVILCGRNIERLTHMANVFHVTSRPWEDRNTLSADILINATPIGMFPEGSMLPIQEGRISHFRLIVDVVATPAISRLIYLARQQGIRAVAGIDIALQQAFAQFSLYTEMLPPREVMTKAAAEIYQDVCTV